MVSDAHISEVVWYVWAMSGNLSEYHVAANETFRPAACCAQLLFSPFETSFCPAL